MNEGLGTKKKKERGRHVGVLPTTTIMICGLKRLNR
jgi:hypothetical protein